MLLGALKKARSCKGSPLCTYWNHVQQVIKMLTHYSTYLSPLFSADICGSVCSMRQLPVDCIASLKSGCD